ncbi:hypothetical protein [Staphylococcus pasteuri]|uniref:hypothetical protein n=1 Tax=Staphylococcus pasteuri TaxID=45972 RepID=UPI0012B7D338|nr:hypothetical protein [Staphylococcus pasteuri]
MTQPTKQQIEEFVRNNKLDFDESYPRSDWWKFKQQRDAYKKQRDELIEDMAEVKRKAEAWGKLKNDTLAEYEFYHNSLNKLTQPETIAETKGYLLATGTVLSRMDKLDGTNDFKEFLEGLESDE